MNVGVLILFYYYNIIIIIEIVSQPIESIAIYSMDIKIAKVIRRRFRIVAVCD